MVERIPSPGVSAPLPVRPAAPAERSVDPRLEAFQRTLATMLGSKVPVSVLARLGDGSFMVRVADMRVADMPVRMMLPPGTQPGAQLSMTVLAASPQPTFGLGDATLHGSPLPPGAHAASLAAKLAAALPIHTAAGNEGGDPGADPGAQLSPAARLLSQVLQGAAQGPASPIAGTTPLAPQGAPDPAQLAAQLQNAIAKSGLFYESHLAQWAEGKRPLAELMAEPQALKAPGTPPTEPATAQLINQQLATHESGHLAWQGQLGPGQPLHWEITREKVDEPGDEGHLAQPNAPGWESRLHLRFTVLGEVEARISLRGNRLQIDLQAGGLAAGLLRHAAPRLEDALAAGGSALAALRIHGRDDA
ncbi:flagellar hook-length control protein FliK [Massilia niabensis]|uniref:Flagellar hook-length control protein FliK n=1 Tax=Massilia niabensis TaxID=544910 RepID=A0ABW0L7A6_9BURK